MPQKKTVSVSTDTARAETTLQDVSPVVPLPDTPQGVMVMGPQVTFRFVQDYSQANSYDYYDVVNVDGASYIAIQNVPADTPITNTDYWVRWNDPNAEFAQLQDTVETFDARLTQNSDDIETLKANVSSNTGAIETLNEQMGVKQDKVRKIGWIGDSYSDPAVTKYDWVTKVAESLNCELYNVAKSGAGFLAGVTFIEQLNTLYQDHPDVDMIVLFGGENDMYSLWDEDNISTAITEFISALNSKFPHIPLKVFGYTSTSAPYSKVNTYNTTLRFYLMQNGVNWSFYDVFNVLMDLLGYISNEDKHPSVAGDQFLAEVFTNCLSGGSYPQIGTRLNIKSVAGLTLPSNSPVELSNGTLHIYPFKFTKSEEYTGDSFVLFDSKIIGTQEDANSMVSGFCPQPDGTMLGYYYYQGVMTFYLTQASANKEYYVSPIEIKLRRL